MTKVAALIDADLIAFRCAAMCEARTVNIKHIKSGKERIFKTRTEFKDYLKEKEYEYNAEDYEFNDIQTPSDISAMYSSITRIFEKINNYLFPDVVEVFLGGGENFRHKLPLPSPYKNNRQGMNKPLYLEEARKYIKNKYKVFDFTGHEVEADDAVSFRAYHYLEKGYSPVIVSSDKDSKQAVGCSVLDWTQDEWETKYIESLGELHKVKTYIKGSGLKFLAFQVLGGDLSDTYQGYELSKKKYGVTKAMNALKDCSTEKELFEALIQEYKYLYPEPIEYVDCHGIPRYMDYKDLLRMYWKCAYMKRSENDESSFDEFILPYGVKLQ